MHGIVAFTVYLLLETASSQTSNLVQLAEKLGPTTLVSYLKKANLDTVLSNEGPFTVFAPSNDAFNGLPADVKEELDTDPELLKMVLEFHVANGRKYSRELSDNLRVPSLAKG